MGVVEVVAACVWLLDDDDAAAATTDLSGDIEFSSVADLTTALTAIVFTACAVFAAAVCSSSSSSSSSSSPSFEEGVVDAFAFPDVAATVLFLWVT
jgi:hypothetical protein